MCTVRISLDLFVFAFGLPVRTAISHCNAIGAGGKLASAGRYGAFKLDSYYTAASDSAANNEVFGGRKEKSDLRSAVNKSN